MLSQKAQDALTEFAAVKKADVQLQTQLGNRKGQIAANVIGAFAESQNSAFGWQVRVFGAENDTKGANAGIFFRRVDGETLYGINSFADYESGDYGEFLRYGIGGELQNRHLAFAMNYYLPITDDKRQGQLVAFSQKGYDANLRISIPRLDFLKVAADYYYFDGKYGGEDDNGFRYGLELQPINDLRIGVFYDDGGEKFGGDIVYVYNFGNRQKRESNFAPDLFAAVSREHSQRIIKATIASADGITSPTMPTMVSPPLPPLPPSPNTPIMLTFNAFGDRAVVGTNPATIGAINIPAGYTIGMLPQGFMHTNGTLIWNPIVSGAITFGVSVGNASQTASLAIAATGFVAVGRVANVNATIRVTTVNNIFLLNFHDKILATLPPVRANPSVLTITQDLDRVSMIVISDSGGSFSRGQTIMILDSGLFRGVSPYTITIVQGSEENEMTLYAEANVDSRLSPSFPQMPKLALAANPRISPSFPLPSSFPRRRESTRRRAANADGAKRH